MFREKSFYFIEQFWACKQIEEAVGVAIDCAALNPLLLIAYKFAINTHGSWLP